MGGRAGEVQVLVFGVAALRAQVADLPEVVAQAKGRALGEVEC